MPAKSRFPFLHVSPTLPGRFRPRPGLVLPGLLMSLAVCAHAQFTAATGSPFSLGASTAPQSIAFGDFNNDGRLDMAVANFNGSSVTILRGDGTGRFTTGVSYTTTAPFAIVAADFNGDGNLDLAIANSTTQTVTLLMGTGTGTFNPASGSPFTTLSNPQSLAIGDFDKDGNIDLAIADAGANVQTWLGDGSGGFKSKTGHTVAAGTTPYSVAVADFNGDGNSDLAICYNSTSNIKILLGDGTGAFTGVPGTLPTAALPYAIVTGDFNRDGKTDIATSSNTTGNNITVYIGDGTGNFTAAPGSPFAAGTNPQYLAAGDVNGDGFADLAIVNRGDNNVSVFLGSGSGSFTAATGSPFATGTGPVFVAITNVQTTGHMPDLVTANAGSSDVSVLLNNLKTITANPASVTFYAGVGQAAPAGIPIAVTSTQSGATFTATSNQPWLTPSSSTGAAGASVQLQVDPSTQSAGSHTGTMHFTDSGLYAGSTAVTLNVAAPSGTMTATKYGAFTSATHPYSVATGDFDGDGHPDLAIANFDSNNVTLLKGDGTGAFSEFASPLSPLTAGANPIAVITTDLNGDGRPDLVVANFDNSLGTHTISVFLGQGAGKFVSVGPFTVGTEPSALTAGDFNSDGNQDLAIANQRDGTVTVLLGNGFGGFTAARGSPFTVATNSDPEAIGVADFDGDGNLDLAVGDNGSSDLRLFRGDGTGRFALFPSGTLNLGFAPTSLAVADLNGDGRTDVVVTSYSSSTGAVLLADSNTGLPKGPGTTVATGTQPHSITVGDFNGDGIPDLATTNYINKTVTILLGDGTGGFSAAGLTFTVVTSPQAAATGDFNGDGLTDLAVAGYTNDNISVLLGALAPATSTLTTTAASTITYSTPVPLTYTVSSTYNPAADFSAPSGTATFQDTINGGTTKLGDVAQSQGPFTFTAALSGGGLHTITATYNDPGYAPAPGSLNITVNPVTTVTLITSSINTDGSYYLQATITPVNFPVAATDATGTVSFMDGTATLVSGVPLTNGVAQSLLTLGAGPHSITAVYTGDSNYTSSTSTALLDSTATLTQDSSSSNPGDSVTFTVTMSPAMATGQLTLTENGFFLDQTVAKLNVPATYTTTALPAGGNKITAYYAGNSRYLGSMGVVNHFVRSATTTTLSSNDNPAFPNDAISFNATVALSSPGSGPAPTGTVQFYDGGTLLAGGTATVGSDGSAFFRTFSLSGGPHSITAVYQGDTNNSPSTSTVLIQNVRVLLTATLSSNSNPAIPGSQVTFTATLSFGAGWTTKPTGTVQFWDGPVSTGTLLGTGTASTNNGVTSASFTTTSPLSIGSHSIAALYLPDNNYVEASPAALTQEIQTPTTTALTSNTNPSTYNQSVTFTATISPAPTTGNGTIQVTFRDSGVKIGTGILNNGVATLPISSLTGGTHSITAIYPGDSNYTGSTSSALSESVAPQGTTTAVSSSANPSTPGQNVTFTAKVNPVSPGGVVPTGSVNFMDGSTVLSTASLTKVSGTATATFSTSSLAVASHTITAVYGADTNYNSSTSPQLTQTVALFATTTSVSSSLNPASVGQTVTFTATINPTSSGGPAPTGSVNFLDGSIPLGTGTLATVNGTTTATFSTSILAVGSHSITAAYGGDTNYNSSTSSPTTQIVNPFATSTSVSSSLNPVFAGQSVTFTATVSGWSGTATDTVTFSQGGTTLATAPLALVNGIATATYSTSTLAVGSDTISTVYNSTNQNYAGSSAPNFVETVNPLTPTTTTLTSSKNPSLWGPSVTFTATVSPAPPDNGTVVFLDSTTSQTWTGKLSGGKASVTEITQPVSSPQPVLSPGTHIVKAVYLGGASGYATSSSPALKETVTPVASGTMTESFAQVPQTGLRGNYHVTGDFNNDGKLDIALSDLGAGFYVLLGDGAGGFTVVDHSDQTSINGNYIATGDLDGDGNLDLVITTPGTGNNITVLMGDGTGNFAPAAGSPFAAGNSPYWIGLGDFNNDGRLDMALLSRPATGPSNGTSTVTVLLGKGARGNFAPSTGSPFGADVYPGGGPLTDFNGDGNLDMAFTNGVLLLGDGTGNFTPGTTFDAGREPQNILAEDFNGDGKPDLAITDRFYNGVIVLIGDGNGGFTPASGSPFAAGYQPYTLTSGDFNGDGKPDIAVADESVDAAGDWGAEVMMLLGDGSGGFTSVSVPLPVSLPNPTFPRNIVAGDFNGDGRQDLSLYDWYNQGFIMLLGSQAATTSSLSTSITSPVTYGTAVPLNLSVSGALFANPGGTATFLDCATLACVPGDGSTVLGTLTQPTSPFTFSATNLAQGTHTLQATLGGNAGSLPETSNSITVQVGAVSTTTTVSGPLNPPTFGQPATLTARVSPTPPDGETVTFMDGSAILGTGTLSGGVATLTTTALTAGSNSITAAYGGDTNLIASTSQVFVQTVNKATPGVTITSNSNPSGFGQAVTFTGTVSPTPPNGETVTFSNGSMVLGTGTLTAGVATLTTSALTIGSNSITAAYAGDSNYFTSVSAVLTQAVNKTTPVITVSSNSNPAQFGQVTFTATLTPSSPAPATGMVTFFDGTTQLGTGNLDGAGAARFTTTTPLRLGKHSITATYNDDANFLAGTSAALIQLITPGASATLVAQGTFTVGNAPSIATAAADFYGDGNLDLVSADTQSGSVTILRSNGTGSFTPVTISPASSIFLPETITTGDFDGDGKPDVVVGNRAGAVTVLLSGSGFLPAPGSPFTVGKGSAAVAPGDFDGDGILDLAVIEADAGKVFIMHGNAKPGMPGIGDGSFTAGNSYTVGTEPGAIVAADFNGDGKLDLGIANYGGGTTSSPGNVIVLMGQGNGVFSAGSSFAAGIGPYAMAVGDFNGDGKPDLSVVSLLSSSVTIALGTGTGNFNLSGTAAQVGSGPTSVAVGDIDGDGNLDLAVTNYGSNNVSVLLGDGKGGFTAAASTFATGANPDSVAVADFNGDGRLDLAVADGGSSNVTLLTGELAPVPTTSTLSTITSSPVPYGGSASLYLVVSAGFRPFTGTATFFDGSTSLGSGIQSGNAYYFTASNLSAGSHTFTATYGGDTQNQPSTSNGITIQVSASVIFDTTTFTYDGTPKSPTFHTSPLGLNVKLTYNGSLTPPTQAGTYPVVATIQDPNYVGSANAQLTIQKATPTITWTQPAAITPGTALSGTQLDASANVPGSFVYTPAAGTILPMGANQNLSVTFTPTDKVDYKTVSTQTMITVAKIDPTVTWTPAAITVGTALGPAQLNASANVPGSFVYNPAAGTVMSVAGSQTLKAVFTPTDTTDYNSANVQATVTVNPLVDVTPPSVTSVRVLWGSQSYTVTGSARNRLPWQITGIQVVFSEPVAQAALASLSGVTPTGFSGLGTTTLTWNISPIALGNFTASLSGIADAAGNQMAVFNQPLKVLYGDVNDDGVVNSQDLVLDNNATKQAYNMLMDMDGDGTVTSADVKLLQGRVGTSLP